MKFISVILIFSVAHGLQRQITYSKNPGCEKYNMSLHYVKAAGPNDTIHYLWDFTKRPTIFMAVTDAQTNLSEINCINFVDGIEHSFNFTSDPEYEFSLVILKLIEFNDVNDTGILTSESPKILYDTEDFSWTVSQIKEDVSGQSFHLSVTGSKIYDQTNNVTGNFTIQLTAFGFENHDVELPRLFHSPNSTQCKIILDNLATNSGFNETRFAIKFIMVSKDRSGLLSKIITRKNLDDENSPGIFSMVDVITPKAQDQCFRGAFLQWRPIIYTSKIPSISNSSEALAYNLTNVTDPEETLKHSLPYIYYGELLKTLLVEQTVVSMGVTEDGFYKSTNFSSWTFLVAYGSPEEEKFSLLVILVMCIGLGLPALLILTGGTYMCARRIRRRRDELSLER